MEKQQMNINKINKKFLQNIKKNNKNLNHRATKGEMFDTVVRVPEQIPLPDYLHRRAEAKAEIITANLTLNALEKFTGLFVVT